MKLKYFTPVLVALTLLAAVRADDSAGKPELHGVLITSTSQSFLLGTSSGANGKWVGIGDSYGDWKLSEYRAKDSMLVLKNASGTELDLALAASATKAGEAPKATVEEANRLLDKMHFQDMLSKILANQKAMSTQQMAANLKRAQGNATPEEMAELQKQVSDTLWGGVDMSAIQDAAAKAYSSELTSDQLSAIGDFYGTPAGQAILEKTPAIQAQISGVLMQQIQANQPQVVQLVRQFAIAHRPAPPSGSSTTP